MLAVAQDTELDRGASAPGTERTCALSREVKPVDELIRFVLAPGGEVVADVRRRLPGRGLWVSATRIAVEQAVKRNVFARGFRQEVRAAADLAEQTEKMLERAALDALAIAGKAGVVVSGFAKVEAALGKGEARALIHASDSARDGRRKLSGAVAHANEDGKRKIVVIEDFSGTQLDLALNRPNVVHAALLAGPGSETFLARVARYARFRSSNSTAAVRADAPTKGAEGQNTE
ncbi:MAG TPA: RNA-binding protein [Pseudolabrys sp.]